MTRERQGVLLALLVVALPLLLLSPTLVGGEVLVGRDLPGHFYPRLSLIGESFAAGSIPRWNPWSFHGCSLFGPRAGGVLYPGYLLFAALRVEQALAWFVVAHLALALAGARRLWLDDLGPRAAFAAGLAYGLGGYLASSYWAVPYLVSAAWLPWAAWGGRLLAAGRARAGVAWIGAAVGGALLASEPQGALLAAAAAALAGGRPRRVGRRLGWLSAGVGLGALIGGVQLLSILAELPHVDRALGDMDDARWPLAPLGLAVDLVASGALGEHALGQHGYWGSWAWAGNVPWTHVSVGTWGLALIAGADPRRAATRAALAWAAAGLLLATLGSGPLALRFPAKWLVLSAVGLAGLVGAGLRELGDPRASGRVAWAALALGALSGALALAVGLGGLPAGWEGAADPAAARLASLTALTRASIAALGGAALLRARAGAAPSSRGRTRTLALAWLAADLLTACGPALPTRAQAPYPGQPPLLAELLRARGSEPAGSPPRLDSESVAYRHSLALGAAPQQSRGAALDEASRQLLFPNRGAPWGVRNVQGFESVRSLGLELLRRDAGFKALSLPRKFALLDAAYLLLHREDLRGLESHGEAGLVELTLQLNPQLGLHRNLRCPPFAYLASRSTRAASLADAVAQVTAAASRDGPPPVVLGPEGSSPAAVDAPSPSVAAEVTVVAFEPERVSLAVSSPEPRWLVVREAWSPDWTATVNGEPASIARADALYRAVRVPAGGTKVTFRYQPGWWLPGCLLSGLGLILLVAVVRRPQN